MKDRLGDLIQIRRGNDIVIVNPHIASWYYTTVEGWEIYKMVNENVDIDNVIQRTSFTIEEIKEFVESVNQVLFVRKKEVSQKIGFSIHLTSNCNMKCKHCRYSSGIINDNLDFSIVKKYINEAIEEGSVSLTITGGEPFTKWEFCRKVLRYVRSLDSKLRIQILTNGSLVTSKIAEELRRLNVATQISLDSLNEERFRHFRGASLLSVVRGIDILLENNVRVTLSTTLMRINIDEIEDIINFAIGRGIATVHFPLLEKGGRGKKNWEEIALSDSDLTSLFFKLTVLYFDRNLRNQIAFADFDSIIERIIYPSNDNCCKCGSQTSVLYPDGTIFPCTNFAGNYRYSLGSISNISLSEIREFPFVKGLPVVDEIEKCRNCEVRWICSGGCKDRANLFYGDFCHPDSYCNLFRHWFREMIFRVTDLMEKNEL